MSISLKDDVLNAVKESAFIKSGCKTPEYRRPTPPPKPNPNYIPPPVRIACYYKTPCGWCIKWDKKCDKKIPERGLRAKANLIEDALENTEKEYVKEVITNKTCKSEEDHEWYCCGVSTAGSLYCCKKCGAHKTEPFTSSTSNGYQGGQL